MTPSHVQVQAAPRLESRAASGHAAELLAIHPDERPGDWVGAGGPDWSNLESSSQSTLIKKGRKRATWRFRHREEIVYVKQFQESQNPLLRWCARLVGLHPAIREWRALRHLEANSVPAVRPIALMKLRSAAGPAHSKNDSKRQRLLLLTRQVVDAKNLIEVWNASGSTSAPSRVEKTHSLISAVAALWALGHEKGYAHPDAHPGNILIQESTDNPSGLVAMFADPMARWFSPLRTRPVGRRAALRSLAMLDHYFQRVASRTDRLRFWREYWMHKRMLLSGRGERRLLAAAMREKETHHAILARRRDRRLRGDCKYFARLKLPGGWSARVVLALERRHVFADPEVPDRTVDQWRELLGAAIAEPQTLAGSNLRLVRRPPNPSGTVAAEVFSRAHRLRHRDIPAPLVLGYLQRRRSTRIVEEYLILPRGGPPQ